MANGEEETTKNNHHQEINNKRKGDYDDEEEDMLALRLGSNYPYRQRLSPPRVTPPPPQPPPSGHAPGPLQPSNTHPLYSNTGYDRPLPFHLKGGFRPNGGEWSWESPPVRADVSMPHQPPPPPPPPPMVYHPGAAGASRPVRPVRGRRNPTQVPGNGRGETVPPPFPWATDRRATVHSLEYLRSHNILTISGDVQCKRCEREYKIEYDLVEKFNEVGNFIAENRMKMHDRAPEVWKDPVLPACKFCKQENSAKPVMADKKKRINWLFLLLGQMLGCCTLEQLKYFCKHTRNHRTGAKDRVLYLCYLCLCKQLYPNGPFDV